MHRTAALVLALFAASTLRAQSVDAFFKDTFEEMVRNDPEFATSIGRHEFDDRWTDISKGARDKERQFYQQKVKEAQAFSPAGLTKQQALTLRLIAYDLQGRLDAFDLDSYLLRVGQLFGFHNAIYYVIDLMPSRSVHDYENILARLRGVPALVDANLALLNEAIDRKIMQPKIVADLVIGQISTQMNQDAAHSHLLDAFRAFPANIPAEEQKRLLSEAEQTYAQQFVPAWRKLHDYMAQTYLPHVRPAASISSMPEGKADYAILVRRMTTTEDSPEKIHAIGESEVKRIETEMQAIAKEAGWNGSLEDFQKQMNAKPDLHFKTQEEMLVYCRDIAKIIEPELPNQFRHLPMLLYGVRPIPADREAATATNAQPPTPDFSKPGWFNLNTYQPEQQVKYDKQALVLHEAVPGHIFQITLAQSQSGLPDIRKFYGNSAYLEGWALYAESLGGQLGLYKDPYSRFGQLASERFRAVRLVVDTGIHQYGWTREQAVDYFKQHAPEASLAEIDRYISWPGQALSYKMGQLQIMALRREAEKQLKAKFDVRDFNDAVIRDGVLPLAVLGEQIQAYIASVQ